VGFAKTNRIRSWCASDSYDDPIYTKPGKGLTLTFKTGELMLTTSLSGNGAENTMWRKQRQSAVAVLSQRQRKSFKAWKISLPAQRD